MAAEKGKEVFFFEKKNQKTFIYDGWHLRLRIEHDAERHLQKFFGSFFKKEHFLAFAYLHPTALASPLDRVRV